MHELSLAEGVLATVQEEAAAHGDGRILSITLRIGAVSHVVHDSLRFAFDALSRGTRAEGCRLDIQTVPARVRCRRCRQEDEVTDDDFACPSCGSREVDLIGGTEMQVASFDMEEESRSPSCE